MVSALGFVIGIAAAVGTSIVSALGISFQRRSHMDEELKDPEHRSSYFRRPLWLTGFLMYFGSQTLGSSVALGQLPTLVLAPVGSLQLVFNALFAALICEDLFDRIDGVATCLVLIGTIIVTIAGYTGEADLTIGTQIRLLQRTPFVALFSTQQVLVVLALIAALRLKTEGPSAQTRLKSQIFAGIAGTLQAETFILGKCAIELLKISFLGGENQFKNLASLGLFAILTIMAVLNLVFFNEALRLGSAVVSFPVCFCLFIVVSFVDSLVYFDTQLSTIKLLFSGLGAAVILTGVLVLSRPKAKSVESSESAPLLGAAADQQP